MRQTDAEATAERMWVLGGLDARWLSSRLVAPMRFLVWLRP
ncbi:hypothetical protein [Corallococcus macrosporus]|uniref:Uncharacterized protein n=2 Tax=Myxococcaceae TaxID=31 RepID=A0A250K4U6_9BACT|nr:hypothetical protein [Corallococcus macrosporus]AEI64926.1 hypothetical protein LILAB_15105 [Corallococcus macrosporus]ATB50356.1 hypothetical protein MYMAC_006011 [Corallococcus macrosporus DSM 14697]